MHCHAGDLAHILGVNRNTIPIWVRAGMPYLVKADRNQGIEWKFDTQAVIQWRQRQLIKQAVGDNESQDPDSLKNRKLAAETSISEIAALEAKGEVVKIDSVIAELSNGLVALKQRLMSAPARLAPGLVGETDDTVIKEEIMQEIWAGLNELARHSRFIDWGEEV